MLTRTRFLATSAALLLLAACNNQGGGTEANTANATGNGQETMTAEEGIIPGENTMGNVAGAATNVAEDAADAAGNAAEAVGNAVENATDRNSQ
jgi:protein involved in sex pheromone biosynthesis